MISKEGGTRPFWSQDGKELFFSSLDGGQMVAVAVQPGATFGAALPQVLFELGIGPAARRPATVRHHRGRSISDHSERPNAWSRHLAEYGSRAELVRGAEAPRAHELAMALAPGTRLGVYEIVSLLGAGGMGEVYRAVDTDLKREVAIKVLPASLAGDAERLARFRREAEVLASLNHPNIAHIHGLEKSDGAIALIMELVEGPTLADRIANGPIPLDEALPIARQIAEALEAAHERSIIHRDLKPANIKVRDDGTVKVLDFGLAKALETTVARQDGNGQTSNSPTITSPAMTQAGIILGTAAYMSPEQARGKSADRRADIWAFGAVLFEMLTGERAFKGEDITDTLANVLKTTPDWSRLSQTTPLPIRRLLHRSLEKDHKRRLADIADATLEIGDALTMPAYDVPVAGPNTARTSWRRGALALVAIFVGVAVWFVAWTMKPSPSGTVARFADPMSEGVAALNPNSSLLALSPDGTQIAYAMNNGLYVRALDQLEATLLVPSVGGLSPRSVFFSPDGEWVGFWNAGQLKKAAVSGGAPVTVCAMTLPFGASWSADNTIVFAQGQAGIWRVSANGGTPEQIVTVQPGERALGPQLLPGGRAILFTWAKTANWNEAEVVIQPLNGEPRHTVVTGTHGRYVPTGHVVYGLRGTVMALPFDLKSMAVNGNAVPVIHNVWQGDVTGNVLFAVSSTGTLTYIPSPAIATATKRTLVWVDRHGGTEPIAAPPRSYVYPRLSPDGKRLALDVPDDNRDIWMWRLPDGPLERLTNDTTSDRAPIWTPDSQRIIFTSDRDGSVGHLFWQNAYPSATAVPLTSGQSATFAHTMSPDGKHLVARQNTTNGVDLAIFDLASPPVGITVGRPLVHTVSTEFNAEVSPDGRWLSYQSDSSGMFEVYVGPFPDVTSDLRQVSNAGGTEPLFSRDGQALFYRAPNGAVMRVAITPGPTWANAPATQVVEGGPYVLGREGDLTSFPYRTYDVSDDGRFLMIKNSEALARASAASRIWVVLNWFEELQRLAPVK